MPFTLTPRARLVLLVLVASTLVGAVCAKVNTRGHLQLGAAEARVMVDYPAPSIVDRRSLAQDISTLQKHAELYGQLLTTRPVLDAVARRMGIPPDSISGLSRITAEVPITLTQPDSELRASQIEASLAPYRLELQPDPEYPVLLIYAAAPSAPDAQRLANDAVLGLRDYLRTLAAKQLYAPANLPVLRQLGNASASVVNHRAPIVIAALSFIVGFALTAAGLWTAIVLRRRRRDGRAPLQSDPRSRYLDDWPHTTRLLPWALAGFVTLLWLTPFNRIQLDFHTPIDLKLDRLLLPFVALIWLIALLAGERARPRLRLTGIHVAVLAFVALAFLSVTLDAHYLNQTMELDLSLKKLPLLVSYVSVFWMMSTAIRPSEVRAFMTLTLVLAVIVGLEIIWEYRSGTNVSSFLSQKLLPHPLELLGSTKVQVDSLGRRGIVGPTDVGLEAVTILTLALPIVVGRLLSATRGKPRLLYGLAVCVLLAAMLATGRKSALVAPLAVLLTMAYFRRREMISLAPLGLVIAVVASVLSPGAVHGTIAQFVRPDSSSVATTSDRTSDYDAIRPDVWSHLLLGRGYGSYDISTYRILDSEILSRTIEMGVLGLLALLAIGFSVILCARRTIARRDSPYAPLALIGAACAACFLTVATLYDELGFPHATYTFLYLAGLVAVVAGRENEVAATSPQLRERALRVRRARRRRADASPQRRGALV